MMIALKRAKVLKDLNGLIIGGMTDMNDNEQPFGKTALEIIVDSCADYDFPIVANMPSGHIANNMPLIMGSQVEVKVDGGSEIIFL